MKDWSKRFIKAFQHISRSGLKLPKLHSWIYHITDSIRSFGAINRYSIETYKSLHKEHVKNPYRLSNKKNIETQIMRMVSINVHKIGQTGFNLIT